MQSEILEREIVVDENSPLITKQTPATISPDSSHQSRVLLLVYGAIILFTFGDYIQLSPRIQVYESILCDQYYSKIGTHLLQVQNCKVKAVQEELATLRGVERLTELIPSTPFHLTFL